MDSEPKGVTLALLEGTKGELQLGDDYCQGVFNLFSLMVHPWLHVLAVWPGALTKRF